jgi:deferrochelatase/peroxidase EfeB
MYAVVRRYKSNLAVFDELARREGVYVFGK